VLRLATVFFVLGFMSPLAAQISPLEPAVRPPQQLAFEEFIRSFARRAEEAPNALARQNLRRERAARFLTDGFGGARDWVGTVSEIAANNRGRAVLLLSLADGSQLMSNDGRVRLGDAGIIQRGTPIFDTVAGLRIGQRVRFDATFLCVREDCPIDPTTDAAETLATPRFVTHFRRITPID
jgi:hypothetical protein